MATMTLKKQQKTHFEMNLEYVAEFNAIVGKVEDEDRSVTDAEFNELMEIASGLVEDGDLEGDNYWEARNALDEVELCGLNRAEIPSRICLED